MVPFAWSIVLMTPEVPLAPCPTSFGQFSESWYGQSLPAVALRYSSRLSVVPDLSERCTTVIGRSGRSRSGFCLASVGSFQRVILPLNTFAIVEASMLMCLPASDTPRRLKTTAIGEM